MTTLISPAAESVMTTILLIVSERLAVQLDRDAFIAGFATGFEDAGNDHTGPRHALAGSRSFELGSSLGYHAWYMDVETFDIVAAATRAGFLVQV